MKTKEISFDVIEQVKRNNKLAEQLETIEKIVEDIYYNYLQVSDMNVDQVKKEIKDFGEEFETDFCAESFLYCIMKFTEINQRLLIENSKNLIK
jgi:hypothetical protein